MSRNIVVIVTNSWQYRLAAGLLCLLWLGAADTPADLDALAEQRSWHELHAHAQDIAPAARDAHWRSLIEQAALGELSSSESGPYADSFALIARYDADFPFLVESPGYLTLRMRVGLGALRFCFDAVDRHRTEAATCRESLGAFLHARPVTPPLAKSAAEIVGTRLNRAEAAPLYALGVEAPGGEVLCTEPDLAVALVAGLDRPADSPEAAAARQLLERCYEPAAPAVLDAFNKAGPGSVFMRNACPALTAHQALTGLRAAECAALAKD